jgi:hypothetical protein
MNSRRKDKFNKCKCNYSLLDASTLFNLKDHLCFNDVSVMAQAQTQIVAPSQYDGTINYFSAKK